MIDRQGDKALELAGANSSGMAGADWADLEFGGTASFTVECWFNADALAGVLVQKQILNSGAGWELVLTDTGRVVFSRVQSPGVAHEVASAPGSIVAGRSYHAVSTYDGTTLRLHLDAAEVDADAAAISMGTNSVTLSIGYDSADGSAGYDGRIDEVAIYDRAITADEIAEHHTVGSQG